MAYVAIPVPWRQATTAPFCFPSNPRRRYNDPSNGRFWSALIGSLFASSQTSLHPSQISRTGWRRDGNASASRGSARDVTTEILAGRPARLRCFRHPVSGIARSGGAVHSATGSRTPGASACCRIDRLYRRPAADTQREFAIRSATGGTGSQSTGSQASFRFSASPSSPARSFPPGAARRGVMPD